MSTSSAATSETVRNSRHLFRLESDLRKHFLRVVPKLFRIETGMGGTLGLPDSFFTHSECVLFPEFKVMMARKRGDLVYAIRADQRRTFSLMANQGYLILIIAAIRATRDVWMLDINPTTLMGVISADQLENEPWARKLDITESNDWILDDVVEFTKRATRHRGSINVPT